MKKMTVGIDASGKVVEDLRFASVIQETEWDDDGELVSEKFFIGTGAKIPAYVVSVAES